MKIGISRNKIRILFVFLNRYFAAKGHLTYCTSNASGGRTKFATNYYKYFYESPFEKNPNGWSDSLRLNYFKTPAALPKVP